MPLSDVPSEDSNQIMAFCINLDRRPDRWENAQREWTKFSDVPANLYRVKAVDTGSLAGCGHSHQLCVDHAKKHQYPWIFVLEDDIVFRANAKEIWAKQMRALASQNRCDIFHPSLSGAIGVSKVDDSIYRIQDGSGLFATLYFASSYDTVLNWRSEYRHIDRWLCSHADLENLTTIPFLATTTDGKSDIRQKEVIDTVEITKTEKQIANTAAQPQSNLQSRTSNQPYPTTNSNMADMVRTKDGRWFRKTPSLRFGQ